MTIAINDLDSEDVTVTLNIANGAQLTQVMDCGGFYPAAILMPAAMTATALTLEVSADNVTFGVLNTPAGAPYAVNFTASVFVGLSPISTVDLFLKDNCPRYIRFRSTTAGAGTNEGAARVYTLVMRPNPNRRP